MLEILKDLLNDLKTDDYICFKNNNQKIFALETAIEILEKIRKEV